MACNSWATDAGCVQIDGCLDYCTGLTTTQLYTAGDGCPDQVVLTHGLVSYGDGGGGKWYWDAAKDKSTADLGTIIDTSAVFTVTAQGTGTGTGCWVREHSEELNVLWFGAVGDGVADDTAAIQATVDAGLAGGSIRLPANHYIHTGITITTPLMLLGSYSYLGTQQGSTGAGTVLEGTGTILFDGSGLGTQMFRAGITNVNILHTGTTGAALQYTDTIQSRTENVLINSYGDYCFRTTDDSWQPTIRNMSAYQHKANTRVCSFEHNGNGGVMDGLCKLSPSGTIAGVTCIYLSGGVSDGMAFHNVDCGTNEKGGIGVHLYETTFSGMPSFYNCVLECTGGIAWLLEGTAGTVDNISTVSIFGGGVSGADTVFSLKYAKGINVVGHRMGRSSNVSSFAAESVISGTDTIVLTVPHAFRQGQPVKYTEGSGGAISGVTDGNWYYVDVVDTLNIKLFTDATLSATVDLLSAVSGSDYSLDGGCFVDADSAYVTRGSIFMNCPGLTNDSLYTHDESQHLTILCPAQSPYASSFGGDVRVGANIEVTGDVTSSGDIVGLHGQLTSTGMNVFNSQPYRVDNTTVIGTRKTGYVFQSGTAAKTDVTSDADLPGLSQLVRALVNDLRTHGLIGT